VSGYNLIQGAFYAPQTSRSRSQISRSRGLLELAAKCDAAAYLLSNAASDAAASDAASDDEAEADVRPP